jgi:hypothetical protein
MQSKDNVHRSEVDGFFSRRPRTHLLTMSVLFLAALGLRVYHLSQPPLDFHPIRQYRSAIIARGYFFEASKSVPSWQRDVAIINKEKEGILEPPVMELLASVAYRIVGSEHLWIPKMLSVIFWLGGGVLLYALTRDLLSSDAAVFSTTYYLFLPFGISASRSFQPDPLMICAFLSSILAILRYHLQPSRPRLALAAVLSAVTMFVKPVCTFAIFAAFVSANISRQGVRRTLTNPSLILFCLVSLLPTSLFYLYGMFVGGFLKGQAGMSFIPSLYFTSAFWLGWLDQINIVIGYVALVVALLGVLLFREGLPRALLVGLWIGYAVFGLIFTYHIHTHDYYQLQLVPIVALSIAPICIVVFNSLIRACSRWPWRLAVLGVLLFASLLYMREVRWRLRGPNTRQVAIAQEIGAITHHSTKTVFLAWAYGKPLEYHGEVSGEYWPGGEFRLEKLEGKRILTAKERMDSLMTRFSPEYFIVTDREEFDAQPDLQQCLAGAFSVVEQNRDYLIFARAR